MKNITVGEAIRIVKEEGLTHKQAVERFLLKKSVRQIRKQMHETQEEFAEHIGMKASTYKRKEAGASKWKWVEIKNISIYSKVPVGEIQ